MELRYGSVWTNVAFIGFFTVVRSDMNLIRVSIGEAFAAALAFEWFGRRVQFADMAAQVGFAATLGRAQSALEGGLSVRVVRQAVGLQRVGLAEGGDAQIARVGTLACVDLKCYVFIY